MAEFGEKLKNVLTRSAKFIGRTANTTAKATKYKVNEMTALNKRRELIGELGKKVYELCEQGLVLPAEGNEIVEQIKKLDEDLNTLRSEHAAEKAAAAEQHAMEKAARATEKAAAKAAEAIDKSTAPVEVEVPADEPAAEIPAEAPAAPALEVESEEAAEPKTATEVPTLNV